jgi:hypothetical protein
MEIMWKACRPDTPPTLPQLSVYLKLEELADRFDRAVWRSQVPVAQLSSIRGSIASALSAIRSQNVQGKFDWCKPATFSSQCSCDRTDALSQNVTTAIADIEIQYGTEDARNSPYFQDEFEGLSQHCDLADSPLCSETTNAAPILDPLVHLLAGRPTKLASSGESGPSTSTLFSSLKSYSGNSGTTTGWMGLRGTTPIRMLQRCKSLIQINCARLDGEPDRLQQQRRNC